MRVSDFDFELPDELIAQEPLARRDASRMLIVNRADKSWRDDEFASFASYINEGDAVVINNTRVFPARLIGTKQPTGARVELFLIRRVVVDDSATNENLWRVLARPARRLNIGTRIGFGDGKLQAEVVRADDASGERVVRFETQADDSFQETLELIGSTPLPPYIKRDDAEARLDRARYQTIYARDVDMGGAIAAPTAGLHFTARTFEELKHKGAHIIEITLHVGYGTFAPVRVDDLSAHRVAAEMFSINAEAARAINETKKSGGKIFAIGTTTTRALESATERDGTLQTVSSMDTDLTITPGYNFKCVNALLTNFHLPQSSLLVLTAAFASPKLILDAYAHAVENRYRFYSYGDCMLIL